MPYAQEWLDVEAAMGGRAQILIKGTLEEMKAEYERMVQTIVSQTPPQESPARVDIIEGRADELAYRLYKPKDGDGLLPTFIWTHGGGFMFGDLDSEDPFCRVVSERTKTAVINVDYRLSPEHKWPVQLNDTLTVYKWALANAARYNLDPNRFYTIGGSAGGLLALATANQIIRDPQLKSSLKGIAALVPATTHWNNIPSSYKSMHKSFKENARYVPVNDKESLEIFYREVGLDPRDSSCFTILAEDQHKNFPPTYFVSCEYDPLRDDAFVMEEALNEAGVRTKHDYYQGLPHYFWIFPGLPQGQVFIENLIDGVKWLLSQ